jgi:hypothetical protein
VNRVEIMLGGEWVPVGGVASVEFHPDPVAEPEPDLSFSDVLDVLRAVELMEAMAPAFRALVAASAAARDATQDDFRLAPPGRGQRPRPAWQSPYGPPQRRRH